MAIPSHDRHTPRRWPLVLLGTVCLIALPAIGLTRAPHAVGQSPTPEQPSGSQRSEDQLHPLHGIDDALIRLPLAAALGAALALRPRRKGTPPRTPPVVQTQIILAVVGAVIMLVVGASLARAFGIVGAANLIRYRSTIEDPKDAVVMLSALAVGLASGVGLYALAAFSTAFLMLALGIIESFEKGVAEYSLAFKAGERTDQMRPQVETVLRRFKMGYALLTSADEQLTYEVTLPLEAKRDRVTDALLRIDSDGHASVEWIDKKGKSK